MAGGTIVVVNEDSIATWSLPEGGVNNGVRITMPDWSPYICPHLIILISPDLSRVVYWNPPPGTGSQVGIYDTFTGGRLASIPPPDDYQTGNDLWFTPDGHEIWRVWPPHSPVKRWKIIEDSESGVTELQPCQVTALPPGAVPWLSSRGYEVTDDGWVLNPTRERVLWLPHRWRLGKKNRTWSGQFLGLLHYQLPEVVILEFFE